MVYVLNSNKKPLMPCKEAKARHLLRAGKAKVVMRSPFTIQLLWDCENNVQDITLGVDAGSKTVGLSATTEKKELFTAELTPRNDVVRKLDTRREFRRARRNRKRRHRPARFENRVHSKHKGWLAPSVEVKINNHLQGIQLVTKILPISKIVIETAEFDIHALKNEINGLPKPKGIEYQHGEMYGFYNARQYVLWRDGYKCRCCGNTKGKLYVVNADGKETGSPEDKYTVCESCFKAGNYTPKKRRHWTHPTFMGIMRDTLMNRVTEMFPDIEIAQTTGAETKMCREMHGIEKSHIADARCISGNPKAKAIAETYLIKPVRRHNRQLHKATINKGGVRKANQAPKYVFGYQLFDKVEYVGQECFIWNRRTSGYFDIRRLDGTRVNGITYKKLKLLEKRKGILIERRMA